MVGMKCIVEKFVQTRKWQTLMSHGFLYHASEVHYDLLVEDDSRLAKVGLNEAINAKENAKAEDEAVETSTEEAKIDDNCWEVFSKMKDNKLKANINVEAEKLIQDDPGPQHIYIYLYQYRNKSIAQTKTKLACMDQLQTTGEGFFYLNRSRSFLISKISIYTSVICFCSFTSS